MAGSPKAERYCNRTYENDPTDHGFIVRRRETPKRIERTAMNDHFFLWNNENRRYELIYQGSADIISLLRLHRSVDKQLVKAGEERRALSFFNVHGEFFDRVFADAVVMNVDMEDTGHMHTAMFDTEDGNTFATAIDYIYCLGLPRSYHEGSLMTLTDYEPLEKPEVDS